MNANTRVTIICQDRVGLISDITGRLFDIGANLGSTSFGLNNGRATFLCSCELPKAVSLQECEEALTSIPMSMAKIAIEAIQAPKTLAQTKGASHLIECSGIDQPGLIARLSEIFIEFNANIVQMAASANDENDARIYRTQFAVAIPADRTQACLATIANTAGAMQLQFSVDHLSASRTQD